MQSEHLCHHTGAERAMSTFSPVGSWSSNGMRMCVCVCVWTEWTWNLHYFGISTYQFIPFYASAIHKHTHTRILKPFEDSEPTGLKVDIASKEKMEVQTLHSGQCQVCSVYPHACCLSGKYFLGPGQFPIFLWSCIFSPVTVLLTCQFHGLWHCLICRSLALFWKCPRYWRDWEHVACVPDLSVEFVTRDKTAQAALNKYSKNSWTVTK